jgi:hypothetical protein
MKVNIELDMTPEEARRLMGWPDVVPLQEAMLEEMRKRMISALGAFEPEAMLKAWTPMSAQGLEQFQKFLWDSASRSAKKQEPPKSSG